MSTASLPRAPAARWGISRRWVPHWLRRRRAPSVPPRRCASEPRPTRAGASRAARLAPAHRREQQIHRDDEEDEIGRPKEKYSRTECKHWAGGCGDQPEDAQDEQDRAGSTFTSHDPAHAIATDTGNGRLAH